MGAIFHLNSLSPRSHPEMDESKSVSRKKEEDEAELVVRIGRNKRRRRWEFISVRFYFQSATLRTTHDGIGFGGPHLVPPPASERDGRVGVCVLQTGGMSQFRTFSSV